VWSLHLEQDTAAKLHRDLRARDSQQFQSDKDAISAIVEEEVQQTKLMKDCL